MITTPTINSPFKLLTSTELLYEPKAIIRDVRDVFLQLRVGRHSIHAAASAALYVW